MAWVATCICCPATQAAVLTWNGTAGATWSISSTNWTSGATPWNATNGTANLATFNTPAATPVVSGNIYANGITFNNTATVSSGTINLVGAAPTITTNASATMGSVLAGSAALTKTGTGTLTLTASDTYNGLTTVNAGTLAVGAGGYLNSSGGLTVEGQGAAFNVNGSYLVSSGSVNTIVQNNGVINASGTSTIGGASSGAVLVGLNSSGTLNMTAGALNLNYADGHGLGVGWTGSAAGSGVFNLSGGSCTLSNADVFLVGMSNAATQGQVNISGNGVLNVGSSGEVFIGGDQSSSGNYGAGTLTLSGSGHFIVGAAGTFPTDSIYLAAYGGSGTINLNGGTLTTARTIGSGGTATINFNGGSLQASSNNGNLIGVTAAYVQNGGATIDDGGFDVTVAQPLLKAGTGVGGLTKVGSGILTLAGANSYGGPTIIKSGTLRLASNGVLPAGTKIMPVGDSITYGYQGTDAGYRGFLYNDLAAVNASFQYVGTTNGNSGSLPLSPVNQTYHDGWSGWTTGDVLGTTQGTYNNGTSGNIGTWLTQLASSGSLPTIITMMIGTNDFYVGGWSVSQGTSNLSAIINVIHADDPKASLLLAELTPRTDSTSAASWNNQYNAAMPGLIAQKVAAGDNVQLVDLNTNFPSNGLSSDGLHPNDTGYSWMASQWATAIRQLAGSSAAIPAFSPVTIYRGATLDLAGNDATLLSISGSGNISLGDGALNLSGIADSKTTFVGVISGSGSVTEIGAGALTLSASNTYSGGTTVSGGTLVLDGAASLLTGSSVVIGSGASQGSIFSAPLTASQSPSPTLSGAPATAVASVPEPATIVLLLAGIALIALNRRFCRQPGLFV